MAGDRTFAYSIAEVLYVDRMGSFLSQSGQADPRRFVLREVAGLYVSPRPYAFTRPGVARQKSSGSLMRLHAVGFATTIGPLTDGRTRRMAASFLLLPSARPVPRGLSRSPCGRARELSVARGTPASTAHLEALRHGLH